MNKQQETQKKHIFTLSREAERVLHIGLPIIVLELVFFLISLLRDRQNNALYVLYRYPIMLEYIMMSLTLVVIGAFLFDYLAKKQQKSRP